MIKIQNILKSVFFLLLILPTISFSETCGLEGNKKTRISGGYYTKPHQFPWMVRFIFIKNGEYFQCGGSLITGRLVLTAKHCTQGIDRFHLAQVAVHDTTNQYQEVQFDKVLLHNTNDGYNDIAIIRLKDPVDLDDPRIGIVCLPQTDTEEYIGKDVKAMGWGLDSSKEYPKTLKAVDLKVDERKQQKYWLYTNVPQKDGIYQDTCGGDSGGPLVHREGGRWTIIGVENGAGYSCIKGEVEYDPMFNKYGLGRWNKVTAHLEWIQSSIKLSQVMP